MQRARCLSCQKRAFQACEIYSLLRQHICLRTISSVSASLSASGHHFPCVDHRTLKEVSVLLSLEQSLDVLLGVVRCTWLSLPQWRSGECEDSPPSKYNHLAAHSWVTPTIGKPPPPGRGEVGCISLVLSLRYLDILYQEQTNPPKSVLLHTVSLCDLL